MTKKEMEARRLNRLLRIMTEGFTTVTKEVELTGHTRQVIYSDIDYLEEKYPYIKCLDEKGRGKKREIIVSFALIPTPEFNLLRRINSQIKEKKAVARYIVQERIDPTDTLFLDGGTAAVHVAAEIAQLPGRQDWTIVTNNPLVLHLLSDYVATLRLVGGDLTSGKNYILNPKYDFRYENLNKAFIGVNSIWYEKGVFCHRLFLDTKIPILDAVKEIIFLADHTKIRRPIKPHFQKLCSFEELCEKKFTIVTNRDEESQQVLDDEMDKFHSNFGPDSFICLGF